MSGILTLFNNTFFPITIYINEDEDSVFIPVQGMANFKFEQDKLFKLKAKSDYKDKPYDRVLIIKSNEDLYWELSD